MRKHTPDRPTTCDVSDLLNEMWQFVNDNPEWYNEDENLAKMAMAYTAIKTICTPDMVTQDEYDFVIELCNKINEKSAQ